MGTRLPLLSFEACLVKLNSPGRCLPQLSGGWNLFRTHPPGTVLCIQSLKLYLSKTSSMQFVLPFRNHTGYIHIEGIFAVSQELGQTLSEIAVGNRLQR